MRKSCFVPFVILVAIAFLPESAKAAVNLTTTSYSENFNGTIAEATSVAGAFPATTANVPGTQAPIPAGSTGSSGWDGLSLSGTRTAAMNFTVDSQGYTATGSQAISGALYSFGETDDGETPVNTERALGSIASGTNVPAFGVELINMTGSTITQVNIDYTAEFWRQSTSSSGTPNTLAFAYLVGPSGSTTYLSDAAATPFTTLDIVGPTPVATGNVGLQGNDPANQVAKTGSISSLNVAVGDSLYLRWTETNDQGNDAALAVDNFMLTIGSPAGVPGDYNGNGVVDAGDYVVWRKGGTLQNEVDNPGTVNAADYTAWRERFGNPPGSGSGLSEASAIPEPASAVLLVIGLAAFCSRRRA